MIQSLKAEKLTLHISLVGMLGKAAGYNKREAMAVIELLQEQKGITAWYDCGVVEMEYLGFPLYVESIKFTVNGVSELEVLQ